MSTIPCKGMAINPEVIKWARETLGLTRERAAEVLGDTEVSHRTIAEWEAGEQRPSYAQLEGLAYKVYKRPLALFFFPEPPAEASFPELFPTLAASERLSAPARLAVRLAVVYYLSLRELFPGGQLGGEKIWAATPAGSTWSAHALASKLGALGAADDGLHAVKALWEKFSIAVFEHDLTATELNGFNLFYEDFPLIVLNNQLAPTAKIYYLCQGLVNILTRHGGVFLNPAVMGDWAQQNSISAPAEQLVRELATKYTPATLLAAAPNAVGPPAAPQVHNLSPRYTARVVREYYNARIDDVACADYLNIKPRDLENFLDTYWGDNKIAAQPV